VTKKADFLPPNTPPPPRRHDSDPDDWAPYRSWPDFELADFLYSRVHMSPSHIDTWLDYYGGRLMAT